MRIAVNAERIEPDRGGAETYVADLCRCFDRLGHQVTVYARSWAPGVLPGTVRTRQIAATGRTRSAQIWSFAEASEAALRRDLNEYDCSVGFINTWFHDVLIPQGGTHAGSLEANARRFPVGWRRSVYRLGKRLGPRSALYRAIERRQYGPEGPSRIVAVSRMVEGHLRQFYGVEPSRIWVIPNAIDVERLTVPDPGQARCAFRRTLGLGGDDLVALFVGHNARLKGLPTLIEALAWRRRVDPGGRPIHLVACGGGRVGRFRRLAEALGLRTIVHLLGFVPDVRSAYWASDFFVLPTFYDPCSLVVLEALACGLPVVSTSCNGASELLTPGVEGFVVEDPSDVAGLSLAMDRLTDDATRRRMAEAAGRLGRSQSFDRHVERLLAVCRDAAEARRNRGPVRGPHFDDAARRVPIDAPRDLD